MLLPKNTSRSTIAQFNETIRCGGKFLQPISRILAISLGLLALLSSRHPDATISARWKYYVAAGVVVAQTAWYEVVYIFPINDEVSAMGRVLEKNRETNLSDVDQIKLVSLLRKWQRLHWGRILLPLLSGIIGFMAVL